jgi:RHS repeat-associated protein
MQRRRKEQIPASQKNVPESALNIDDAQMAEFMAKAEAAFAESGEQTRYFIHDPMGLHSQQEPDGTWRHMIRDGLNSIRGVTDDALSILESREYDPFGNPSGAQGTSQTPFGFTGEMTDPNGLVHLRARDYNPVLGVFPSPDPVPGNVQDPMSLNQYMYAGNNPINNVDPSGECWHSIGATNDERRTCWQLWQERYPGVNIIQQPPQYGGFDPDCIRQQYFTLSQMDYLSFVQNWNSGNYQPCPGSLIPTPTPTVTCTPALTPTSTLPVQTLVPPAQSFVTPTPIPGANDPLYCYGGAQTPNLPPNWYCIDPSRDTQEEILAHILVTEAGGTITPATMANIAQVIWNRRGSDSVGNAMNPATIAQRSAPTVNSVRDVTFAGAVKAVDRSSAAWTRAMNYANALMQAHVTWANCGEDQTCRSAAHPDFAPEVGPDTRLGSTMFYCAVDARGVDVLRNNGVLVFSEETSPGTFHAYTTDDCGNYLR